MDTKRVVLALPEDVIAIIEANSTPRTKAAFVSECVRQTMAAKPTGILERIAEQMEKRYQEGNDK